MAGFKSSFGFNASVFEALKKKTEGMGAHSCHGGLVFDEIKLSENISVKTSEELSGFVDLGPFTESNETTVSDHGLAIMFQPFQGNWTQILGVFSSKGLISSHGGRFSEGVEKEEPPCVFEISAHVEDPQVVEINRERSTKAQFRHGNPRNQTTPSDEVCAPKPWSRNVRLSSSQDRHRECM
ncbi:uncharacterized protein LOC142818088 [Rhipicephalus microplus]|uniref:uncharacterized protein LOC142818088 n=1 Tax=Rhipicephalus microplus TaxID=6941 RepID=UPI003F6CC98F